jgi:hypothetical protein
VKCTPLTSESGEVIGFVCGRRRAACSVPGCRREYEVLCDWKLKGAKAGKTCDAKLCGKCTTKPAPDKDLCPAHARAWAEWKAARAARAAAAQSIAHEDASRCAEDFDPSGDGYE